MLEFFSTHLHEPFLQDDPFYDFNVPKVNAHSLAANGIHHLARALEGYALMLDYQLDRRSREKGRAGSYMAAVASEIRCRGRNLLARFRISHFDCCDEGIAKIRTLRIPIARFPVTSPSFCTKASERVYITASGREIRFSGTRGL